jgi:hypothetical protein
MIFINEWGKSAESLGFSSPNKEVRLIIVFGMVKKWVCLLASGRLI